MTVKKFNTRFPVDLIEEAKVEAAAMHISLNSFIVQAVMSHTAFMRSMWLKRDRQLQGSPPATALRDQDGDAWPEPIRRGVKVGRNDLCPCGSGRKAKVCHPDYT